MRSHPPRLRAVPPPGDPGDDALTDLEAERAVLGAVLLAGADARGVYERARRALRCQRVRGIGDRWEYRGDFGDPRHNVIFACMGAILARGEPVDHITMAEELRRAQGGGEGEEHGLLNTVGGSQYIGELTETIPTWAHVDSHARIVGDLAAARRLAEAFHTGLRDLRARGAAAVHDALAAVAAARPERRGKTARSMSEVVESAWEQVAEAIAGRRRPVPTGFRGLDGDEHNVGLFAGGLHRGELLVLAADQGGGKTAWVLQVALHGARQGHRVLIVSQEMSAESLFWRLACAEAKVDPGRLRSARLTQDDITALQNVSNDFYNLPITVVDCGCSVDDIRTAALAAAAAAPLHLLVVDYLQILDPPEESPEKAHEVIDHNALAMKKLSRELDCPVVLLSQFNRSGQNAGRKPRIQDLKGSGGIESHADAICVLWPEGGRPEGPMPPVMRVDLLVLKQRNGPTAEVPLVFERALTRFCEVVVKREGAVPPTAPDDLDMPEGA